MGDADFSWRTAGDPQAGGGAEPREVGWTNPALWHKHRKKPKNWKYEKGDRGSPEWNPRLQGY